MQKRRRFYLFFVILLIMILPLTLAAQTESHSYIRANGKIVADNFYNGTTTQLYYYHYDALGNLVSITDQNGKIVESQRVEAFGNELQKTKTVDVSDRSFIGKEKDSNNLFYFGARYYDAGTGRFISGDPIGATWTKPESMNKYSYAVNNPLKYIDRAGEDEIAFKIYQFAETKEREKALAIWNGRGTKIYVGKNWIEPVDSKDPTKEAYDCQGLAVTAIDSATDVSWKTITPTGQGIAKTMEKLGWESKLITPKGKSQEQIGEELASIPRGSIIIRYKQSRDALTGEYSGAYSEQHTMIASGLMEWDDVPINYNDYKVIQAGIDGFVNSATRYLEEHEQLLVIYPKDKNKNTQFINPTLMADTPELGTTGASCA